MATLPAADATAVLSREDTESELRRSVRIAWIALGLTFGIGGLWSLLAPLSGAVIGQGVIKVESSAQLVQHMEGGVVRRILVKEGQRVKRGERVGRAQPYRAAPLGLDDFAEPAGFVRLGQSQSPHERCRDSFLGRDSGVRGLSFNLYFPILLAHRADD